MIGSDLLSSLASMYPHLSTSTAANARRTSAGTGAPTAGPALAARFLSLTLDRSNGSAGGAAPPPAGARGAAEEAPTTKPPPASHAHLGAAGGLLPEPATGAAALGMGPPVGAAAATTGGVLAAPLRNASLLPACLLLTGGTVWGGGSCGARPGFDGASEPNGLPPAGVMPPNGGMGSGTCRDTGLFGAGGGGRP
eukprot:scaffold1140_cov115-Isochrysis_galbana.AAC.2